jgi:NADH:ubiquinone oxidoreductase subunit 4 (subunit M)
MFGTIQTSFINEYCDINKREFLILFILSAISFFFGIYPNGIFSILHDAVLYNILYVYVASGLI